MHTGIAHVEPWSTAAENEGCGCVCVFGLFFFFGVTFSVFFFKSFPSFAVAMT